MPVAALLGAAACARTSPTLDVAGREMDLAAPSTYGRFLEARAAFSSGSPSRVDQVGPSSRANFDPQYARIALRSGDGLVNATLYGGAVRAGTEFAFSCPPGAKAVRLGWYARRAANGPLRLTLDGRPMALAPPAAERLVFFDLPIELDRCRTTARLSVTAAPEGDMLWTEPRMLVETSTERPPIILISVDTLRADVWRAVTAGKGLAGFHDAAVRYTHAFSSFPSTPMSHSVMLSGLAPTRVAAHPVDDQLSVVSRLNDAGYSTLGFVAGGLVRSEFGFAQRPPGFALGFDLYLESYQRTAAEADVAPGVNTEELTTYTLASALERSLRWFRAYPTAPVFQFLHGYDVHEYRTVDRAYFDRAARDIEDRAALDRCVTESGVRFVDGEAVHYPFEPRITKRGLSAPIECQRLLFGVFYRARALAAADTLERYLTALRELGVFERALIILTSDHGESLRDERGRDGQLAWGHNRILTNNLHVPLWVKFPEPATGGERDEVAGVIGIRRLVETAIADPRARPDLEMGRSIPVDSNNEGEGLVLPDGTVCASNDPKLGHPWLTVGGGWAPVDDACTSGTRAEAPGCAQQRACAASLVDVQGSGAPRMPNIPPDLEAELRALGYIDP